MDSIARKNTFFKIKKVKKIEIILSQGVVSSQKATQ